MKKKGCLIGTVIIFILLFIVGSLAPDSPILHYNKSHKLYNKEKYEEAILEINSAIQLDSTESKFYELRGLILHHLKDTIHSKQDFVKTITISKTDSIRERRIKELFNWNIEHGNSAYAKDLLYKELELYKSNPKKHKNAQEYVALKFIELKDTMSAAELYHKMGIEHKNSDYLNYAGILQIRLKKFGNAIREFNDALKIEPKNDTLYYNLGMSYLNLKNVNKAKTNLRISKDLGNTDACHEYRKLTAIVKYNKKTKCCDGTHSNSSGSGACSHHGGVCGSVFIPYREYTVKCD